MKNNSYIQSCIVVLIAGIIWSFGVIPVRHLINVETYIFEYLLILYPKNDKIVNRVLNNPNASFLKAFNNRHKSNLTAPQLLEFVRSHEKDGKYSAKLIQSFAPTLSDKITGLYPPFFLNHWSIKLKPISILIGK